MIIGVTGYVEEGKNLFANGYTQNMIFFSSFMKKHFGNEHTIIPIHSTDFMNQFDHIDIIIQLTAFSREVADLVKAKYPNCKMVFIQYGHEYYIDLQRLLPNGMDIKAPKPWNLDEIWISPHYRSTKYYYEALYDCKVRIAPFIWQPLNLTINPFTPSDFKCDKVIYIMEPNVYLFKSSLLPLIIVNELWKKYPDSFDKVVIIAQNNVTQHKFFMTSTLPKLEVLHSHNQKAFFNGRVNFCDVFKKPGILLSHQENWGLNYIYLEAMHIRIPWVHNSPFFKDGGYYYEDKNIPQAVIQLKKALDEFKPINNDHIIERHNPDNPMIVKEYKSIINQVVNTFKKYAFIHPTKSGGTAISKYLKNNYKEYFSTNGHLIKCTDYNKPIIVIRDVKSRFISMFKYWKYGSHNGKYIRSQQFKEKYKNTSLLNFIDMIKNNSPDLYTEFTWHMHYEQTSNWIQGTQFKNIIVIYYENNLEDKIHKLIKYLNIPFKNIGLKKINVSFGLNKEDKKYLDDNIVDEFINEYFKNDIELVNLVKNKPQLFKKVL